MSFYGPAQGTVRLLAGLGAALGLAAAVGCGLPPTDVGLEKPSQSRKPPLFDDNTAAKDVALLLAGNAVVLEGGASTRCVSFGAGGSGASNTCAVRDKPAGGAASAAFNGTCSISDTPSPADPKLTTYEMSCATASGGPCIQGASTDALATLTTDVDFGARRKSDESLDGYVVTDKADPSIKMAFHESAQYCADVFGR